MATSQANDTSGSVGTKPSIVLLTIDKAEFYDDMYQSFTELLQSKANMERVTTLQQASVAFNRDPKPAVVLSADESLTIKKRGALVQEARNYVRSGGVIVFMGLFSSFSRPPDIDSLFSKLGLPWRKGDYHRTTFELNGSMRHFDTQDLAASYSQKAVHLKNVAPEDAVYLAPEGSRLESRVFGPMRIDDLKQAPAAFIQLGQGKVGFVGDVNNEEETPAVVLAMCGV